MPLKPTTLPTRKNSFKLAAITAVVLLAHGGVLYGTTLSFTVQNSGVPATFETRMIAPATTPTPPTATTPPMPSSPAAAAVPVRELTSSTTRTPTPAQPVLDGQPTPATRMDGVPSSDPAEPTAPAVPVAYEVTGNNLSALSVGNSAAANTAATALSTQEDVKPTPLPAPNSPSTGGGSAKAVGSFVFPAPIHLQYKVNGEIKGFAYYVRGDLQWQQDGKSYDARLKVSHFLLGSRIQTSRGELSSRGLEPVRFGDKVRSEVAAHFDRAKGKVTFSANTPEAPLLPGTQDHLSAFLQLASMMAGAPSSFPEGASIVFDAVGPRSVESWTFKVGAQEKLNLPGGTVNTVRLSRDPVGDYGTRGEVWLAPSMGFVPVRIRVTEPNNDFMDMKWSDTVAP